MSDRNRGDDWYNRQGDAEFIRDIANKVIVPRVKIKGEKFVQEID